MPDVTIPNAFLWLIKDEPLCDLSDYLTMIASRLDGYSDMPTGEWHAVIELLGTAVETHKRAA